MSEHPSTMDPDLAQATPASMNLLDLSGRPDSDMESGANARLAWGSRSDVGLLREHNEDSFLVRPPLFAVCDGMGGHAAGEVASSIAVHTLAEQAPERADSALLGAAVEAANMAVIEGPAHGRGREGMGCTATACVVEGDKMAVAHVGDSRLYLLHKGTLVRVTHDHSFVEELVDAGEITADEARVHPSRSVITRALGSDPDMYADHFTLDVERGERIILCSDGLSSMVTDSDIEDVAVSTTSPQSCADALVSAALVAGGHDNVTVVVVDILNDGTEAEAKRKRRRAIIAWIVAAICAVALLAGGVWAYLGNCWYLTASDGHVAIMRGLDDSFLTMPLSEKVVDTDVSLDDLPETVQHQLEDGIAMGSEQEAHETVESYRVQIERSKQDAAQTANDVRESVPDQAQNAAKPTETTQGGAQ